MKRIAKSTGFANECAMLPPTEQWVRSQGLLVKTEVLSSWGACDVVACELNSDRIRERLNLRQLSTIGPAIRVDVLRRIPDGQTGQGIDLPSLQEEYARFLGADRIALEVDQLLRRRFVKVDERGILQRVNGWEPLHRRLLCIELKLDRIGDAIRQATANLQLTGESYIGLPLVVAERVIAGKQSDELRDTGIGLLAVVQGTCRVLVEPRMESNVIDPVAQMHCIEQFWPLRVKGK